MAGKFKNSAAMKAAKKAGTVVGGAPAPESTVDKPIVVEEAPEAAD